MLEAQLEAATRSIASLEQQAAQCEALSAASKEAKPSPPDATATTPTPEKTTPLEVATAQALCDDLRLQLGDALEALAKVTKQLVSAQECARAQTERAQTALQCSAQLQLDVDTLRLQVRHINTCILRDIAIPAVGNYMSLVRLCYI